MESVYTVAITIVGVLGSAGAWKFYENRIKLKHVERIDEREHESLYRNDLKERITTLEEQNKQLQRELKESRGIILEMTKQLATVNTKVNFMQEHITKLETENNTLKGR